MPKKLSLRERCLAMPIPERPPTQDWFEKLPADLQEEIRALAIEFAEGGEIAKHYGSWRKLALFVAGLPEVRVGPNTVRETLARMAQSHAKN